MDWMDDDSENVAVLKERKLQILRQKNEERKSRLQKGTEKKTKELVEEESIDTIVKKFNILNEEITSILQQIEDVNVPKESLPELFDACYCKLEEWQKIIALTSHVFKFYHKRRFQDIYNELNEKRQKLEQNLMPEKQFSFNKMPKKPTKNETGDEKVSNTTATDEIDATRMNVKTAKKFSFDFRDEYGFREKENENLSLEYEQISKKDIVFKDLTNCHLSVEGGANTIHFVAMSNCRILCGPVSTSVFVENCRNCNFVVACQQLRVHETHDTDFYLHVTSRAIIENCERVRFAPYNWKYERIDEHFELSRLDRNLNNWNLVNDFNWLSSAPSPNWSVIEETDRIKSWD